MPDFALSLTATEPLFFRDGRPAATSDAVVSSGRFPPAPSVLYGALRGGYFSQHPADFSRRNTEQDPTRSLVLNTILLQHGETRLFPLPADLVQARHGTTLWPLQLREKHFVSSLASPYYLTLARTAKVENHAWAYLTETGFQAYSHGEQPTDFIDLRDYLSLSSRMGIARHQGVVREGALFRNDRTTLEGPAGRLSFYLAGQGLDWPSAGRLELGSDGAPAFYQSAPFLDVPPPTPAVGEILKVVLMTPGLFETGWHPRILASAGIELLTGAVGKSYGLGGFDMQANAPKTMYRAVPAGAVYFVRATSPTGLDKLLARHGQSWSDYLPREGFGLGYLARPLTTQPLPFS